MGIRNHSTVTEFLLSGLTEQPELQMPLFWLFSGIYIVTVMGNLGMISIIRLSPHLHTPVYYLLSSVSFLDFAIPLSLPPKCWQCFYAEINLSLILNARLSCFFFCVFVISECYMLVAMAYDHYVAICSPLLYNVIMFPRVCSLLVASVFSVGFTNALIHGGCILRLSFCESNIIKHYFCDIVPLIKLSCSSTYIDELLIFVIGGFNMVATSLTIIISYAFILTSILSIHSKEGGSKAFSTCSSHLTAVLIFYGSLMSIRDRKFTHPGESVLSILHHCDFHVESPDIQSQNKEVKNALVKLLRRKISLHNKYAVY
uniref:Olfactory receptor family 8 subfamily D member 4 n=1 Tax=Prolemur simus TaxID=1328070 RepID=A0A8C8ZQB4_PROSS